MSRVSIILPIAGLLLLHLTGPVARAAGAPHMVPGQRCYGEISSVGEEDHYLLDAAAGSKLKLKLTPWKGESLIARLRLIRPGGGELSIASYSKFKKKGQAHQVSKLVLPEDGTYVLIIRGESGTTGAYDLTTKAETPGSIKATAITDASGFLLHELFALGGSSAKCTVTAGAGSPSVPRVWQPDDSTTVPSQKTKGSKVKVKIPVLPLTGTYGLEITVTGAANAAVAIKAKIKPAKPFKGWFSEADLAARGSISGRLIVGAPSDSGTPLSRRGRRARIARDSRPGELLVRLGTDSIEDVLADHPGLDLEVADGLPTLRAWLLRVPEDRKTKKRRREAARAVAELAADPRVISAEPNGVLGAANVNVPNDALYPQQWHYRAINLEDAWSVTTGSSAMVVAVVDSGIIRHEDLDANVLPGYDFVSDATTAGDGDGVDADPTAVGSFHGVHVAGTIGAVTNNGIGVAGVAWRVRILPVRVLGEGGGTSWDAAKGILFAAGVSDPGLPTNPTPARVINMSFGSPGDSPALHDAVRRASARGALLVAAAGNDGSSIPSYPAAYDEVLSVSAVNPALSIASYSNYGSTIDLAAPGGQLKIWGEPGGIVSTYRGSLGEPYSSRQGTSMASPHVAGVAALMLSANPGLSASQVAGILKSTAHDIGSPGRDDLYGAGLLDAGKAVRQAASTPASGPTALDVVPATLSLGPGMTESWLTLRNRGAGSLAVSSVTVHTDSGGSWLSASLSGSATPARVNVQADVGSLAEGSYRGTITIHSGAGNRVVPVRLTVAAPMDAGTATVYLLDSARRILAKTTTTRAKDYGFTFTNVLPGAYGLAASAGYEADSSYEVNDWFGEWPVVDQPQLVEIQGEDVTGAGFAMHRVDTLVDIPGVGGGPVRDALAVKVVDGSTGAPIEGARVWLGNGSREATTTSRGQVLFEGSLSGTQTVTVSASGYEMKTYAGMDAQFMSFRLAPTRAPSDFVDLRVRIRGLLWYEEGGIVLVGDKSKEFIYDGWNDPVVTLSVPRGRENMAVSVVVFDGINSLSSIGYAFVGPYESSGSTVDLWPWTPDSYWYTSPAGSVTLPGPNFDSSSVTRFMMVATYADEFPILLGLSVPLSSSSYYLEWASLGDELDAILAARQVYAAVDANGSFTYRYFSDGLSELPGGRHVNFIDVPRIVSPADGATVYTDRPTLSYTGPAQADLLALHLTETATGRKWLVFMDGGASPPALPVLPQAYFRRGYDYEWQVQALALPAFEFDEFRWDHLQARVGDESATAKRKLLVR